MKRFFICVLYLFFLLLAACNTDCEQVGHNYKVKSNNDGTHVLICRNNSTHIIEESCEFGEWVLIKEPQQFEEGKEERVCEKCNYKEERLIAPPHEHEYSTEWTIDIYPTETSVGYKSHHCLNGINCKKDVTEIPMLPYSDGLVYKLNSKGDGYIVKSIDNFNGSELNITPSYNNLPVVEIGLDVFRNCTSLTSVDIPNSVEKISDRAFYNCTSLTNIKLPNSITSIGSFVFYNCTSLTSVDIPEGVISINYSTFEGCTSLVSIKIPSSMTSIGTDAFRGCTSLTSIIVDEENSVYDSRNNCNAIIQTKTNSLLLGCNTTIIPNGVKTINSSAFSGCTSLTNIEIPDSVTSIMNSAFSGCTSLTSIEIPDSVTILEDYVFSGCTSLISVKISNNTKNILDSVFYNCTSLTSIEIPNGVISIGPFAFSGCTSLTSIKIPNTVTSIGASAFNDCTSLTSIVIPNSVTSIGQLVFYNCGKLTIYCEAESSPSSWGYWNAFDCPVVWGYEGE